MLARSRQFAGLCLCLLVGLLALAGRTACRQKNPRRVHPLQIGVGSGLGVGAPRGRGGGGSEQRETLLEHGVKSGFRGGEEGPGARHTLRGALGGRGEGFGGVAGCVSLAFISCGV
jgi:hypothetical protein